jgi:hypothetical protein
MLRVRFGVCDTVVVGKIEGGSNKRKESTWCRMRQSRCKHVRSEVYWM